MKKIAFALSLLFLTVTTPAQAASQVILTAPTSRHLDGTFINDQLAKDLAVTGRLGMAIFPAPMYVSTWQIDPSLVEDVIAMSQGYKVDGGAQGTGKDVASAWLLQLKRAIAGHRVEAIAYGNPSEYWIKKFFPHDHEYFLSASSARLSKLLGRGVLTPTAYASTNYFSLSGPQVRLLQIASARTDASAAFLDSTLLENYKLNEIKILNPQLTENSRQTVAYDLASLVNTLRDSVRVSTGKFTITSTNQKLPITLINDFASPITVDLVTRSTNERIFVSDIRNVTVAGKSKLQILVPVKVYTSGDSGFTVTVRGHNGNVYGQTITYPLKIAVISSVATWITTAAAVVLFGAAILQSLRRLRRGRKHHEL